VRFAEVRPQSFGSKADTDGPLFFIDRKELSFEKKVSIQLEETMAVKIDKGKCTGCGTCVDTCPVSALEIVNDKVEVDADACVDCGACTGVCPVEALSL
jgi:ferredoxin